MVYTLRIISGEGLLVNRWIICGMHFGFRADMLNPLKDLEIHVVSVGAVCNRTYAHQVLS